MTDFKIISDSSCDLPLELLMKIGVELVPYYVSFDGVKYMKENIDITLEEFYNTINVQKAYPKTSLPPISDYTDIFSKHIASGLDVLCICLTSKFSGSYQSAINASRILKEEYPDRTVYVVDSMQATLGQGLLVLEAVRLKNAGLDVLRIIDIIEQLPQKSRVFFYVDSLEHLQHGGRVGKAQALMGSILNIKPIITLKDGELIPHSKVRGKKKAVSEITRMFFEYDKEIEDYEFRVIYGNDIDEAEELLKTINLKLGNKETHPLFRIGATIGCHAGPTALGIAVMPKYKI